MGRIGGWGLSGKRLGNGFGKAARKGLVDYTPKQSEYYLPTDLNGRPRTSGLNSITGEPNDRWIKPGNKRGRWGGKLPRKF